jgi:hypothetical protein
LEGVFEKLPPETNLDHEFRDTRYGGSTTHPATNFTHNHSTQSKPSQNRNQNQSLSLMREKLNSQQKPGLSSNNIESHKSAAEPTAMAKKQQASSGKTSARAD